MDSGRQTSKNQHLMTQPHWRLLKPGITHQNPTGPGTGDSKNNQTYPGDSYETYAVRAIRTSMSAAQQVNSQVNLSGLSTFYEKNRKFFSDYQNLKFLTIN